MLYGTSVKLVDKLIEKNLMLCAGMPHCLFFLPTYATSVGVSSSDASFLLSLGAVADLAGRLTFGFLLDLDLFPKVLLHNDCPAIPASQNGASY
jgi:cyanate permease